MNHLLTKFTVSVLSRRDPGLGNTGIGQDAMQNALGAGLHAILAGLTTLLLLYLNID